MEQKSTKKTTIHGHIVSYDPAIHEGIYYLSMRIGQDEAKVFFDEAYNRGSAVFEDHMGYKYKLIHNGGEYQLVRA